MLITMIVMRGGELDVNGAEEGEDDGLEQSDQQFHKIEGQLQCRLEQNAFPAEAAHCVEDVFTCEDVSKQTNRQSDRAEEDGDDFDHANEQEDQSNHKAHEPLEATLWTKGVDDEAPHAEFLDRQIKPDNESGNRETQGCIQVSGGWTEERIVGFLDGENTRARAPTNRANAGQQAEPVGYEDVDKQRAKKWKG